MLRRSLIILAAATIAQPAFAQPADLPIAAATTSEYPAGVKISQTPAGPVYADAKGRTLYGMDMRTVLRWSPDASKYCAAECAKNWEPMLAPAGSKPNVEFPRGFGDRRAGDPPPVPGQRPGPPPLKAGFVSPQAAPDWSIIEGPAGLQYVYKGWHMVYVRKGEKRGATGFDGAENFVWNTLKFVPPVPQVDAPMGIKPVFVGGAYSLADKDGRLLFNCAATCADATPLAGAMASKGVGDWSVGIEGDLPQWRYRGAPVYISTDENPANLPQGASMVKP